MLIKNSQEGGPGYLIQHRGAQAEAGKLVACNRSSVGRIYNHFLLGRRRYLENSFIDFGNTDQKMQFPVGCSLQKVFTLDEFQNANNVASRCGWAKKRKSSMHFVIELPRSFPGLST